MTTPIRSEPLRGERENKPRSLRAPLSREDLDRAGPWLRLLAGIFLIAGSSYATITGVGEDFAPLLVGDIYSIPIYIIAGAAAAALLSLGEWLTSERIPLLYAAFLFADARYTQWQIGPWVDSLAMYHLASSRWAAPVVSFLVSWGLSLAVARYGEILLFGRRR